MAAELNKTSTTITNRSAAAHTATTTNGRTPPPPLDQFSSSEFPTSDEFECKICPKNIKNAEKWHHHKKPFPGYWPEKSRPYVARVSAALESQTMHFIIITLVMIDLIAVMIDLVLADVYKCEEHPPDAYEEAETALRIISLTILGIFVAEQVIKLAIFGIRYFFVFWHLFDAVIIITAFVLELALSGSAEAAAPFLVILRMWRIIRVGHAVADAMRLEQEVLIEKHHDHIAMLIDQLKANKITVPEFISLADRDNKRRDGGEEV